MAGSRAETGRRWSRFGLSYMASGGSLIAGAAAQLLTFALLARTLGVDQFAMLVSITAITAVATPFCGLGAAEAMVRCVARDRSTYPTLLGHNLILGGLSGAVLVLLGTLALPLLLTLSPDRLVNVGVIGLMLLTNIVMVSAIVLAEQVFLAHSRFGAANLVVIGFALARTVAAAIACFGFGIETVAEWSLWQAGAHLVVIAACIAAVLPLGRPRFAILRSEVRNGIYFSVPIGLRALRQNADLMALSLIATPEILASYGLARRILDGSYMSIGALNRIMYTGSAAAAASGLHAAMTRIYRILVGASLIGAVIATVVWAAAPLLPWVFGHDYVSLVPLTRSLCWLLIVMAIGSVAVDALGSAGHHGHRAALIVASSILGILALPAAAAWDGVEGVIIAAYLADAVMVLGGWWIVLRLAETAGAHASLRGAPA